MVELALIAIVFKGSGNKSFIKTSIVTSVLSGVALISSTARGDGFSITLKKTHAVSQIGGIRLVSQRTYLAESEPIKSS